MRRNGFVSLKDKTFGDGLYFHTCFTILVSNIGMLPKVTLFFNCMNCALAPIKPVSSQRSGEIKAKAGIASNRLKSQEDNYEISAFKLGIFGVNCGFKFIRKPP